MAIGAVLAACSTQPGEPEPEQTGTIPEQLEALEVTLGGDDGSLQSLSGVLQVTGADKEFTLQIGAGTEQVAIEVLSPGATPLGSLEGVEASVELTEMGMGGRSLIVSDDTGPLYVGVLGDGMALSAVESHFGADFVRWGDEVGSQTDGTFVWSYAPAVFATDDGDVELSPGEVASIKIDGLEYRVVVSASYEVGTNPDADELPGCSPESMLGFELLRVAEPVVAATITRLPEATVAYVGCTAPGGGD